MWKTLGMYTATMPTFCICTLIQLRCHFQSQYWHPMNWSRTSMIIAWPKEQNYYKNSPHLCNIFPTRVSWLIQTTLSVPHQAQTCVYPSMFTCSTGCSSYESEYTFWIIEIKFKEFLNCMKLKLTKTPTGKNTYAEAAGVNVNHTAVEPLRIQF